jgi:hypothetical protein
MILLRPPVYGADMLAHNRGSGRGDSGGFLHIRIGLDTSRDKSGQGGNTTEPYQERTDYWGRFERRLWNQARIIGRLALQRQHGAVGTTELPGLSRDRQNRCQYANDLKWPARPPQASPHNTPSGGAHAHTQSGAVAARPTLPSPRLLTGPAIIATRVPRELLTKIHARTDKDGAERVSWGVQ